MNNKLCPKDSMSPNSIMEMVMGFQKSRILLTGYELGVFTVLGDEIKSSMEVAKILKTDERATDRLMNALCSMNLLEKKEDKFVNTPLTSKFLVKGKPAFMSGLMHSVNLWNSWSTLTDAVRQGTSVLTSHVNERLEDWVISFIAAMHWRACKNAPDLVKELDLSDVSRILDIGGGSGAYTMAMVQAKEGITATIFDLPNVIELTKKYIEDEGLSGKVTTIIGDYNINEFGTGFDLVFLSAIVHANSFEQNSELIKKAVNSLNPKGQIVIQDFVMDQTRTSPPSGAIFALNMLVGTEGGDTYTEDEIRGWLKDAGISDIIRKATDFGTSLIIGRKV